MPLLVVKVNYHNGLHSALEQRQVIVHQNYAAFGAENTRVMTHRQGEEFLGQCPGTLHSMTLGIDAKIPLSDHVYRNSRLGVSVAGQCGGKVPRAEAKAHVGWIVAVSAIRG